VIALQADLTKADALYAEINQVRPSHIVHLAAISSVMHANEDEFYRVNLFGTQNLLTALSQLAAVPTKILLASSANVYGSNSVSLVSEERCPKPINHYGISKLAMEFMSSSLFSELPIVTVRPFNYTGVWHDNRFVVPKIVEYFQRRAPEIELGNLDVLREYNDVRMVSQAYLDLLELGHQGETYNIASGRAVSLRTIILTLEALTEHKIKIKVNRDLVRLTEIPILSGSSKKIESLLGPLNHYELEDTLSWMLNT
jgi:nucleoside-diphosphate-sugar epimerase